MLSLSRLQSLFKAVDLEGAVKYLDSFDFEHLRTYKDKEGDAVSIRCLASEAFDCVGRYGLASQVIEADGQAGLATLKGLVATPDISWMDVQDRQKQKRQVWAVIQWGFAFYRTNDYDEALKIWKLCHDALLKLRNENWPCNLPQARVCYGIGLVYRQKHAYRDATPWFSKAITYLDQAVKLEQEHSKLGSAFSRYNVARSLGLGEGWICYTSGTLDLATSLTAAAKMMLREFPKEPLIKAYVDVVRACIQMSRDGDRLGAVEEAISLLKASHLVFTGRGHSSYALRAANELSLAHIRRYALSGNDGDLSIAQDYAREVKLASSPDRFVESRTHLGDSRWYGNSLVAESRICRLRGDKPKALAAANEAVELTASHELMQIDALISRGEAKLMECDSLAPDAEGAKKDFENAMALASDNPKVFAACQLHLARCLSRMRRFADAHRAFEHWKSILPPIDNAFLRNLAREVEVEVYSGKDFMVPGDSENLSEKDLLIRLRGWLTEWALRKVAADDGGAEEAAALLNIGHAAFFDWRKKAGLSRQPKSPDSSAPVST